MKTPKKKMKAPQHEQPKTQAEKFQETARNLSCDEKGTALDTAFSGLIVAAPAPSKAAAPKKD